MSNVLNRPDAVPEPTRRKVLEAVTELGYVRNAASGGLAAHWRRSGFATWLDERVGHEDGSVQSRYDHITTGMRQALTAALTDL